MPTRQTLAMKGEAVIKVRVFKYHRQAEFYWKEFTREHDDEIIGLNRKRLSALLRDGTELHFVCWSGFDNWSRGRKYEIVEWQT